MKRIDVAVHRTHLAWAAPLPLPVGVPVCWPAVPKQRRFLGQPLRFKNTRSPLAASVRNEVGAKRLGSVDATARS